MPFFPPESVPHSRICEAAVAFGDIRGDGQSGTVELVAEKEVAARELLGQRSGLVGEIDGFLIDGELLEKERRVYVPQRVESREETAGEDL